MAKSYTPKRGPDAGKTFSSYYQYRQGKAVSTGTTVYRQRQAAARQLGFKDYGARRIARVAVREEMGRLKNLGVTAPEINWRTRAGREKMAVLERARVLIERGNISGERGAKKQLPEKLKSQIRALFTDKDGKLNASIYYPLMRSLYGR